MGFQGSLDFRCSHAIDIIYSVYLSAISVYVPGSLLGSVHIASFRELMRV